MDTKRRSVVLNVNTGPFACPKASFRPHRGVPLEYIGEKRVFEHNPLNDWGTGVYSALLIVGLHTQQDQKIKLDDIVQYVRQTRIAQMGDPGSSFIMQRGLYKYTGGPREGEIEDEESVRI